MNGSSTSLAGLLVGWLTDYYLLATPLLLVAFVAWRWVRQPVHRIMVAWMVILELIVLAVLCALPLWPRVSLIATTSQQAAAALPAVSDRDLVARLPNPSASVVREDPASNTPFQPEVSESTAPPVPPKPYLAWTGLISVVYLSGAALVGLWLCWGVAATTWLLKRAQPAAGPLRAELCQVVRDNGRPPRLLVSSHVVDAVALGVLRPTIVLPAGLAESGPPHTLRAVLSHEWAHVRNRDLWLLALGRCLLGVLFAHPLFWWLRRAIRSDQELLADAVAAGDNRPAYADELLRLIRKTAHSSPIALSPIVGIREGSSQLSRRIVMLLDETLRVEPTGSRFWLYRALAPLVLLGVACSLVTFQPARSVGEPTDQADVRQPGPANSPRQVDGRTGPKVIGHIGGGTYTSSSSRDPGDIIILPGYWLLMQQEVLNELNITAEQMKLLNEIEVKYHADMSEFYRKNKQDRRKLSQDELQAAQTRWELDIQKQVEEALKPQQMQALEELALREMAFSFLRSSEAFEKFGVTKEQKDHLLLLNGEIARRRADSFEETIDNRLAVLTAEQRDQFQAAALRPEGAQGLLVVKGDTEIVHLPSTSPYPDLSEQREQEKLGLSATQKNQVRDILAGSVNLTDRLLRELQSLPPEERKFEMSNLVSGGSSKKFQAKVEERRRKRQAKFEAHPVVKTCIELRKRFEAVLTPEQLAAYKERAVRNVALQALRDSRIQNKIGVSDQQKAAIERLSDEFLVTGRQFQREWGRKMLEVLTPPQQEKLREKADQNGWLGLIRRPGARE